LKDLALYVLLLTGILNLVGIGGLFYKFSIMGYQHKLMWSDYARRKGLIGAIVPNGHAPGGNQLEEIDQVKQ
jgi:hypothetical protein